MHFAAAASFLSAVALALPGTPTAYTVAEPAYTSQPDISFSGGSVMASGINVYAIFYGDHSADTQSIVQKFVTGLGSSDWWGVTTTYTGDNGPITTEVNWAGSYHDNYSRGKKLSSSFFSSDLNKVIDNAIAKAGWTKDAEKGIYVVFTAPDVAESSGNGAFCNDYCGYHGMYGSLKLAMIGDATRCPGTLPPPGATKGQPGCMQRYYRNQTDPTYSVNKNQHADSMVDVLAHELSETASDYANAWRDSTGYENGDKCAAYFVDVKGVGSESPFDSAYNVEFSTGKFLIQSMWSATEQKCILKNGGASAKKIGAPRQDAQIFVKPMY